MTSGGPAGGFAPLPSSRLRRLEGWGMVARSMGFLYPVREPDEIAEVFELARSTGHTVVPRGNGYSYGDVSVNGENIVLDTTALNRVLDWNPETGIIRVQPGVTIRDLWRHVLPDGYWPTVVPGAMGPTMGGCVSVNVHGKNDWRVGGFGMQVLEAEVMLPSGERVRVAPDERFDLFQAVIGGLGVLGVLVSVTLRMKRIPGGNLRVRQLAVSNLAEMRQLLEDNAAAADHMVGWIDGYATGRETGRGLVQLAYETEGDPETFVPENQDIPPVMFGVVPRSKLWIGMKPVVQNGGMRFLNLAQYTLGRAQSGKEKMVPLAQFEFFHDYVPNWKYAFRPLGIIQYQVFAPEDSAEEMYARMLEESRRAGFVPFLVVFKKHRADTLPVLRYIVDGYSVSFDFHATTGNLDELQRFLTRLTEEVVLPAGGKFYPAKDLVISASHARTVFGDEAIARFREIKRRVDPEQLLQSDLYRRMFGQD